MSLRKRVTCFRLDERGVTTSEYALLLVLVALAVAAFGSGINDAVTGIFRDLMDILAP